MGWRRVTIAVLVPALAGVACGSGTDGTAGPEEASSGSYTPAEGVTRYPLTLDNCGVEVTFDEPPQRVLILGDVTVGEVETFVMLGIHDRIVANTQSYGVSDRPGLAEQVAEVPTGGLAVDGNFAVPAEQVLAMAPDLVVGARSATFDPDRGSPGRDELADAGIPSLVNPAGCAGGPGATASQRAALAERTVESSYDLVHLLGEVFDVTGAADDLVDDLAERVAAIERRVAGRPRPSVLLAYPGMSMMNANGLPGIYAGGIYDDVIHRAGAVNAFAGGSLQSAAAVNEEELAATDVDVLVVGQFRADEDPEAEAERLFERFPEWEASRTRTWVTVSDGPEVGPVNAWGIEAIARTAHPDAF